MSFQLSRMVGMEIVFQQLNCTVVVEQIYLNHTLAIPSSSNYESLFHAGSNIILKVFTARLGGYGKFVSSAMGSRGKAVMEGSHLDGMMSSVRKFTKR